MMSKWEYFIISLLAFLIGIMICTFQEVWEIRRYIESFNNNPNVSCEFAYIKDFMDRNIEYFSVFTGVAVTVVSILVALALRAEVKKEVAIVNDKLSLFSKENIESNKNHKKEFNKLNADYLTNIGSVMSQLSSQNRPINPIHSIYLNLFSLKHYFKLHKIENIELRAEMLAYLKSIIKDCNDMLKEIKPSGSALVLYVKEQTEIMNICPDECKNDLFLFLANYNQFIDKTKKQ